MSNKKILCRVAIPGAIRRCGWRYVWYVQANNDGWKFDCVATNGMYPNEYNDKKSKQIESEYAAKYGECVHYGRP